jgi:hypothetical protein
VKLTSPDAPTYLPALCGIFICMCFCTLILVLICQINSRRNQQAKRIQLPTESRVDTLDLDLTDRWVAVCGLLARQSLIYPKREDWICVQDVKNLLVFGSILPFVLFCFVQSHQLSYHMTALLYHTLFVAYLPLPGFYPSLIWCS